MDPKKRWELCEPLKGDPEVIKKANKKDYRGY